MLAYLIFDIREGLFAWWGTPEFGKTGLQATSVLCSLDYTQVPSQQMQKKSPKLVALHSS